MHEVTGANQLTRLSRREIEADTVNVPEPFLAFKKPVEVETTGDARTRIGSRLVLLGFNPMNDQYYVQNGQSPYSLSSNHFKPNTAVEKAKSTAAAKPNTRSLRA